MGEQVIITMPGGEKKPISKGTKLQELANQWDKEAVAAQVDGALFDLSRTVEKDAAVSFVSVHTKKGLEILRHSASHVMAQAVKELFPTVKLTFGPHTENGFYYDFDYDRTFTPQDVEMIEKKMSDIIAKDEPFIRNEVSKEEAVKKFQGRGETYKVEHLEDLPDYVTLYGQGTFLDLCEGPHIPSTGRIKAFRLLNVSGTYWRGDARNRVLQRIYGTAFPAPQALEEFLHMLEEARKRDHRKLGKELDLFSLSEEAGPGMVIYHPKGAMLRTILEDFEKKEHLKRGYQIVIGPALLRLELWKQSGHFENYRDKMYFTKVEDAEYGIKPMNCLAHMLIYKSQIRSYRDLPIRYFELGTVYRHEKSGELHGLLRVRGFTQDDAHILCRPDQLNDEICAIIEFVDDVMRIFGFEFEMELSTRPEKSIGEDEDWERATQALLQALKMKNLPYDLNEGEGAFYGPKIDVKLKDALNRRWQCATIQVDFAMPERFDLTYVGSDGGRHRPVMLHRVILGAMERFIGVLIEHYAGAFPVWLAPTQAILMTVTDKQIPYAEGVYRQLIQKGVRVEKDFRNEKLGFKIREAQIQKIPYMLVVGDREVKEVTFSPRKRSGETLKSMTVEDFVKQIESEYPTL
ncbi:MAG: threonine--tRNA ligase [Deltaproteobacteria bacterium RBG_19FT_COMBO_46_12]|nr:MAG: threonine--tRNA ligase [Deltaproteobacteria bacterium RBG_19FT_COMBO_46_12]